MLPARPGERRPAGLLGQDHVGDDEPERDARATRARRWPGVASTIGVASGYITKAKVLRAGSRIMSMTPPKRAFATSSAAVAVDRGEDLDVELAAPVDGQLEQPHRVARRRRVEDGDVERVAAGELDELVERRHLLGARRVELLAHRRDRRRAPAARDRVLDDPVGVGDRRRLGVDAGRPQAVHRRRPARARCSIGCAEDLADVGRGVGRHEQRAIALAGRPDGRRAGDDGLADAALASEEDGPGAARRAAGPRSRPASSSRPCASDRPSAWPKAGRGACSSASSGHQGAQPGDPAHLAVEERDAPGRASAAAARSRRGSAPASRSAHAKNGVGRLLGRQDAVDDELGRDDPQAGQLGARALASRRSRSPRGGARTRTASATGRAAPRAPART